MEREIREIVLPGGESVLARVHVLAEAESPEGADDFQYDDVGTRDQLIARAQQLNEVISGVGTAVLNAARAASPDEVTATFGVELAVKPGKALAAVIADGEARGSVSVTLTWHKGSGGAENGGSGGSTDGNGPGGGNGQSGDGQSGNGATGGGPQTA